jgi:hypothetical protein
MNYLIAYCGIIHCTILFYEKTDLKTQLAMQMVTILGSLRRRKDRYLTYTMEKIDHTGDLAL